MKLTTEELRRLPSHYCKDCETVFGYDHDCVDVDEIEGAEAIESGELELICCPNCGEPDPIIQTHELDDHMLAIWTYIGQLELKDTKRGSGLSFMPYPWDGSD